MRNVLTSISAALLLFTSPLLATCTFGFLSPVSYPANSKPGDVTTGDFNEDGFVDVAIVNRTMFTISILLGNGSGGFGNPTLVQTNYSQDDIQSGDFNNDGHVDLVLAIPWSNNFTVHPQLKVLLGQGNGTFSPVAYTDQQLVYQNPRNIALGDFNKDGKMDAATTKASAQWSSMQNVGGRFAQKAEYAPEPNGGISEGIAVGDFDGDGNADIAITSNLSRKVYQYFGVGDGTFTIGTTVLEFPHAEREPVDVEAGDFNGDGKDDLAILTNNPYNSSHGPLQISLSNGVARTFAAAVTFGGDVPWSHELLVRDMDGDGRADVLIAGTSGLVVYRGIGDGTFAAAQTFAPSSWLLGIAIADFDRDGGPDVVGTNFGTGEAVVLLNTCGRATLNLNSSANPVSQGVPLTVTGTVVSPAAVAATGTFTLKRGTTPLASGNLNGGTTLQATMNDLTPATYTFTLEYSGDSRFVASTKTLQQVVVTPPFGPPPGLNAISFGGPVQLSWYATASTDHYDVERNNGAGWVSVGNSNIAAFTDNSAPSTAALLYRVRAVAAGGSVSEFGPQDLALTYAFTDGTLTPGVTTVKLDHLAQLRNATNAARALASLGAMSWADPSPTVVRHSHVTELRTAIAAARSNLGLSAVTYTDPSLSTSTAIKAIHFEQLRSALR
jgi:hypothetical protein